ncbi:double zinc ribbon domain-containing protein [Natranaeroarchaeum aerophilus]|uniref:CopG family transcriptional regulator n=1 Tax=Natranaeroarchaeum aerophilus TaxID=2917711 RepID=A0AAE3FSD3_9EURY|nr:CopG family transcriptional regulator [Natranaeroarchaeum aerophilus]MCL9814448.1 CopG family transcriptional regulator [Natranaeroarchaeum aerophilus]
MSKITFRADDDLVEEIEAFDASKSEVLREALRSYIEDHEPADSGTSPDSDSLDALVADRVDELIDRRLDERLGQQSTPQDVTVNVSIEDERAQSERKTESSGDVTIEPDDRTCTQCGEGVGDEHVYCPNCGEKASKRSFCECGDELRSDWAFCPGCGRRTPAADVLDPR